MTIDKHKTKQANLKRKLRDLDQRIGKLDWQIFLSWRGERQALQATRASLDQRRREVRRELKARPTQ